MRSAEYLKRSYSRVVIPESDGTYRGEILEFPGCLASGDTAAETLSNLESVAESWIESVLARGQSVPEPFEENEYSGKLVLRLAKSIHQKASRAARRDGVSLNTLISNCVAEHVGARKAPPMMHYSVTNFSQQNNMMFLGSEKTYFTTITNTNKTAASSGSTASTVALDASPSGTTSNPWKTE
jgi:predicted RNase H-like HicB family nuclease